MEITKIQKIHHEFQVFEVFLKKRFLEFGLYFGHWLLAGFINFGSGFIRFLKISLGSGQVLGFDRFGT